MQVGWLLGRHRLIAIGRWFLVAIFLACTMTRPTPVQLFQQLPDRVGVDQFDLTLTLDDSFMSGHSFDSALDQLGKQRSDATAVFKGPSALNRGVGAAVVDGVTGHDLVATVVATWNAPAVTARVQQITEGRVVWILTARDGHKTLVYERAGVVYFVHGESTEVVADYLSAMP